MLALPALKLKWPNFGCGDKTSPPLPPRGPAAPRMGLTRLVERGGGGKVGGGAAAKAIGSGKTQVGIVYFGQVNGPESGAEETEELL